MPWRTALGVLRKVEGGVVEEVDLTWRKIWDEERKKLIDGLKNESPLLLNQVLLEMKDAKSFRVSAQKAVGENLPPL